MKWHKKNDQADPPIFKKSEVQCLDWTACSIF